MTWRDEGQSLDYSKKGVNLVATRVEDGGMEVRQEETRVQRKFDVDVGGASRGRGRFRISAYGIWHVLAQRFHKSNIHLHSPPVHHRVLVATIDPNRSLPSPTPLPPSNKATLTFPLQTTPSLTTPVTGRRKRTTHLARTPSPCLYHGYCL